MHWRGIRKKEKGGAKTHRSEKRAEREGAFVFPIHLSKPKTEAERPVLGAQSSAARPHWAEVAVRGSCAATSLRRRRAAPHPRAGSQLPAAHKPSGWLGAPEGDVAGSPAPAARSTLPGPWPLHRPVVGADGSSRRTFLSLPAVARRGPKPRDSGLSPSQVRRVHPAAARSAKSRRVQGPAVSEKPEAQSCHL